MQNISTLFPIIVVLTLLSWQCQSIQEDANSQGIYFTGELENASQSIYLQSVYGTDKIEQKDGRFSTTIPAKQPQFFSAFTGRDQWMVYARPGDSIRVTFDADDFAGSFIMENPLSEENLFLNELSDSLDLWTGDSWEVYALAESAALESLQAVVFKGLDMVKAFQLGKEIDVDFFEQAKLFVNYKIGPILANYTNYHKYVVEEDSLYEMGPALKAKLKVLEQEWPERLGIPDYISVLKAKKNRLIDEMMKVDTTLKGMNGYMTAGKKVITASFKDPAIVAHLQFDHLNEQISFEGSDDVEEDYQQFIETAQSQALVTLLQKQYDKWAHLKAGMQAPEFTYPDIDSVLHALSDYQGKYVYIDVWATWCGPCIAEQPHLAAIEEMYADNEQIVFIGVSIDADIAAWKKMVQEKEMYGVQLIADGAWKARINQDYNIVGIPRFILIDPRGKLVDASAHRPSSELLKLQLNDLLEVKPVRD